MKMNPTKNDSSPTLLKIRRHSNGRENRETQRAEFDMRVQQIGLSHIVKMSDHSSTASLSISIAWRAIPGQLDFFPPSRSFLHSSHDPLSSIVSRKYRPCYLVSNTRHPRTSMIMKINPTKNDSSPTLFSIRHHWNGRDNRETHSAEFEMRVERIGLFITNDVPFGGASTVTRRLFARSSAAHRLSTSRWWSPLAPRTRGRGPRTPPPRRLSRCHPLCRSFFLQGGGGALVLDVVSVVRGHSHDPLSSIASCIRASP